MRFGAISAAWLAVGTVLVTGGFAAIPLGWATVVTTAMLIAGAAAITAGFVYAYRRGHETDGSLPEAFIIGNTTNSEFTDNQTTAPRFQIGDAVDSKYEGNRTGRPPKRPHK